MNNRLQLLREGKSHSCPGFYLGTISQPHCRKLISQWSTGFLLRWGSRDHSSGQLEMLGSTGGNWRRGTYTKESLRSLSGSPRQVCDWGGPPLGKTVRWQLLMKLSTEYRYHRHCRGKGGEAVPRDLGTLNPARMISSTSYPLGSGWGTKRVVLRSRNHI